MKKPRKLLAKTLFRFLFILLISFQLCANPDEIELQDKGIKAKITKIFGKEWQNVKEGLDSNTKKARLGEYVARKFFANLGYKILEEHYKGRMDKLKGEKLNEDMFQKIDCTTKKGPDNGIDGVFFLSSESLEVPTHVIVNEAKFRPSGNVSIGDFGFVKTLNGISLGDNDHVQQCHSKWNRQHFDSISCLSGLKYDEVSVIRTATVLSDEGKVRLYEIRDKTNVPSTAIVNVVRNISNSENNLEGIEDFIDSGLATKTFSAELYSKFENDTVMPILKILQ